VTGAARVIDEAQYTVSWKAELSVRPEVVSVALSVTVKLPTEA